MGTRVTIHLLLVIVLSCAQAAYSETAATHKNTTDSTKSADAATQRQQAAGPALSEEEEARKKLLNDAADADPNLTEGRSAMQAATESIWGSLSEEQQSELSKEISQGVTEKLDAVLKGNGLVLSSPEKREKFLKSFQTQLDANSKRGSSEGLSELIAAASSPTKGDPQKRQEQLAAQMALQSEMKKNGAAVDFLNKNLGWSKEDSLVAIRRVEEQSRLLAQGTPKEKAAAQTYLYSVFLPIYGAGMQDAEKPSNAIANLFANSELRESEFGKIARPFITAGMGQNFTSKENPDGACAGVECARDLISDTLVRSAMKGNSSTAHQAVEQFEKDKTLPATLKTSEGTVVPTISDEGVKALANIYTKYDNGWLATEKDKLRESSGLKDFYDVDRSVSFKNEQELDTFLTRPEVRANNGATIWVSKKSQVPQSDGSTKEVVSGHVVTLSRLSSGAYLVRDPNIKGLSFDARIDPRSGRFTYSYPSPNGKSTSFEWDNFFPSPNFWQSATK